MPRIKLPAIERLRERFGSRVLGMAVAIGLELLLIGLLLLINGRTPTPEPEGVRLTSFSVEGAQDTAAEDEADNSDATPTETTPQPQPQPEDQPTPEVPQVVPDQPAPPQRPPILTMSRDQFASLDISNLPRASTGPPVGPAAPAGGPGDSAVIGTAPDGSPLYGARWYREPTDNELAGYLSTATPDSWALIACKTAPQWRVEDCVGLDEYPKGSNIQRAVLAAAWQFQVRPPRRGRQSLVGSWVRIRIDYGRRSANPYPGG